MKGTISWIECAKELPPENNKKPFRYSNQVIVTDGLEFELAVYCHQPAQGDPFWQSYSLTNEPTHWAYINFPEPI